ncbi:MAG TPA: GDSL-type esterase/lipase family protein [Stellaceae bacterium]|nr:GDSL-type esterase/lipase family protein [Stellaceae bacterium]
MVAIRVCFLGDSLTNGTSDTSYLGWTGRVCAAAAGRGHDVTQYNLGIRRETSVEIARRWLAEVTPRLVPGPNAPAGIDGRLVFAFGNNDAVIDAGTRRVSVDETLATAAAMLGAAKRLYPTLCVGPAPSADPEHTARVLALCEALAPCCARIDIPYLAVAKRLSETPAWMDGVRAGDGAHPAAAGYAALAEMVEAWPAWRAWLP